MTKKRVEKLTETFFAMCHKFWVSILSFSDNCKVKVSLTLLSVADRNTYKQLFQICKMCSFFLSPGTTRVLCFQMKVSLFTFL